VPVPDARAILRALSNGGRPISELVSTLDCSFEEVEACIGLMKDEGLVQRVHSTIPSSWALTKEGQAELARPDA
jgi:predicted transcriptional regulator